MSTESAMKVGGNHRKLIAWQEAMKLVELIYRITVQFPKDEIFGLTAQLRRSAVSVPSNIAEGAGRNSSRELLLVALRRSIKQRNARAVAGSI